MSPAGARGLLQLTMDAAQKYGPGAGLNALRENQLYQPETSITVGAEYIEYLSTLIPGMLEPVAVSYYGGEDNVARWLERAKRTDPGVFTAEIGFDETKGYVQKVMSNYRVYRRLYTADMMRRYQEFISRLGTEPVRVFTTLQRITLTRNYSKSQ